MAYTIKEFAALDPARLPVTRVPRCICEGVEGSTYRCPECYWAEFSDFFDAHPIGAPAGRVSHDDASYIRPC